MRWTNKFNLPEPVVRAVQRDTYNPGKSDITVTRLVLPPRVAVLQEAHADEIEEDVSDGFFRMLGRCVHKILEEKDTDALVEHRFYSSERLQGLIVSGQVDRYDFKTRTIQDYKFTTCYSAQNGVKDEWVAQLNLLALLARENGYTVSNLELILLLRDYSKTQSDNNPSYPSAPILRIPVEVYPDEKIEWYLNSRLKAYISAKTCLPECTPEERWMRPNTFAVMKPGGKRAVRVFDDEGEALAYAQKSGETHTVEKRCGNAVRCESFCPVRPFCGQCNATQKSES